MKQILSILGVLALCGTAIAQPAYPGGMSFGGTVNEYINFTNVNTTIDLADLGGAQFTGIYESAAAVVEVDANVYLQAYVVNGGDAQTGTGHYLPTGFYTSVKGTGNWNGFGFDNDTYSGEQGTLAGTTWFVAFAPGAGNGLKTRLGIQRNGLKDHAGTYATNTNITWSKW
jgi:hypothetical protein